MLPTFFLAGVAKAGTTSLSHYLGQHPEVFMCDPKEPHHFSVQDDGWPDWAVQDRRAYEGLFAAARPDQARGEASTWTLYSEKAAGRIAEAIPDARYVVILRHPTDRAYSHWCYNRSRGNDDADSFEAALEAEPGRIARGAGPWHHHYVRAGCYAGQLERCFTVLGRDRVLVVYFDDLTADAPALMRRVYAFLGVDPAFRPDTGEVHNRSVVTRSRALHEVLGGPSAFKTALRRVLPTRAHGALGRRVRSLTQARPAPIDPATRRALDARFRPEIERLAGLLGGDVPAQWLERGVAAP